MPREKFSDQEIMAALLDWRGDVLQAARQVGISRKRLYERLAASGLDEKLGAIRSMSRDTRVSRSGAEMAPRRVTGGPKSRGVNSTNPASGPIVQGMSAAAPVAPFPERPRRPNIRIRPDHVDALVEARFDLISALRQEVSEQDILERFLSEALRPWLTRQVAAARGEAPASGEGADRG